MAESIKVNRYDRIAGLLVASLILIGGSVATLFFVWLSTVWVFNPTLLPVPVERIAGRADHAPGVERALEAPGEEEMPEVLAPQVQIALASITDSVTSVSASWDLFEASPINISRGKRNVGDNRPRGPLGDGDNTIPRWERWEIRYLSDSLSEYAKQLDFFHIELAAAGGKPHLDYASNFTAAKPATRRGPGKSEDRIYMTWKSATLRQFDRQLLGRGGIDTAGRIVMQFYPQELEEQLARIEMDNARKHGHSTAREFLKTVFGVRPTSSGYEHYIIEQRFRAAPL